MLTFVERILFLTLLAGSLYLGYVHFRRAFDVIRRGEESGAHDQGRLTLAEAWDRLRDAAVTWLTLAPTWKTRTVASLFHAAIAWGFVFYFLVNAADVYEGFVPGFFLGDNVLGGTFRFFADFFTVSVLVGMSYFLVRRFVRRPTELGYRENVMVVDKVRNGAIRRDSALVGSFIIAHVGFRLLAESFEIGYHRVETGMGDPWQPVANLISLTWATWPALDLRVAWHFSWWMALGLILVFLPYFPYTKHFHLIMSGVNFLTRPKRTSLGELPPIDFENEAIEQFGAAKVEQLPWTHLVDAYACIMCNRCQDACPAYVTGKELSPAALEVNKRYYINEHAESLANGAESEFNLLDFAISESAVWACTACGACIDICPVGNEPMFDIMHIRRNLVLNEDSFPHELQSAYRGMERNSNPWNQSARDRLAWAKDLDVPVPTSDEKPDAEVLWWVGCAPSYDPRAQQTAQAFAKILNAAGVDFAVLGEREGCTGDVARRSGNEYLFSEMAQANVETLNEVQPQRIVATCPHCLHTLGKEYGQFGGHYEVIHHTQLISELVAAKRLDYDIHLNGNGPLTFHDPCYLGRQNDIVDAPRDALAQGDTALIEMPRHGKQSFCCGAGGAQFWKEEEPSVGEEASAVNAERYREAAATGAKTVAVGCPFCLTMMSDAANAADEGVEVKDVAELVAAGLR